jgi:hypothetical protein
MYLVKTMPIQIVYTTGHHQLLPHYPTTSYCHIVLQSCTASYTATNFLATSLLMCCVSNCISRIKFLQKKNLSQQILNMLNLLTFSVINQNLKGTHFFPNHIRIKLWNKLQANIILNSAAV